MFTLSFQVFLYPINPFKEPGPESKVLMHLEPKNGDYWINSQTFNQPGSEQEGLGELAVWFVVKSLKLNQGSKVFYNN